MTGNPNEELRIENPSGAVSVSRPSALWTRVTGRTKAGEDAEVKADIRPRGT